MIRLAYLIPTLDEIGGAERQLLLLAKAFAARGWHVTVIVLSGYGGDAAEELKDCGIFFYSLHMRKAWLDPLGWIRYLAWHAVNRPDIVHAHLPHATFFSRFARLIAPVPVLVDTIHTIHTGTRTRRFLMRRTRSLPSHVTCVANSVAHAYTAARVLLEKRVSIVPNAIDTASLPSSHPMPESTPHPFLWIAVGRLTTVKDYPTLLRAFAQLPEDSRLTIAGAGPDQASLAQLVRTLGIEDRVHFAGFVANIWPLLAASDAFVLSSLWEGLPVSILEASAAGLPVVATQTEGAREALNTCESGWFVPVGDHTALATAMAAVMAMTTLERSEIGTRNRQITLQHYSLPVIANRWADLYTHLLDSHPKPARRG
jgi:glycosyltransferase involved in cell wall biosynthesis